MKHFIPLILVGFLAGAVIFIAPPTAQATLPNGRVAQQHYWEERIKTVGGAAAYEELAGLIANFSVSQQHQATHIFGGTLYQTLGINGLAVCDTRFNYACYHEFLGQAISDLGISSVIDLNQKCFDLVKTSPLACQHGIGHGALSYFGYDEPALKQALDTCKSLPFRDEIGGCYNGVYMEYSLQTMLAEEGTTRELVDDNWLAPCDSVDEEYLSACAYSQPQWWNVTMRSMQHTSEQNAVQIGKLCTQFKSAAISKRCFDGYGVIVPSDKNFDPLLTRELCNAVSDNKLYQLYCKASAGNAITTSSKQDGTLLCDGLTDTYLEYCMVYATNEIYHGKKLPQL
ncbi:hypothetical protein KW798_02000 [Candidatus Parcubacteria bacterium]|nr:hypothetical protein [Candidatus Parcubacteria bacterium]